jgi:hypothetical protein
MLEPRKARASFPPPYIERLGCEPCQYSNLGPCLENFITVNAGDFDPTGNCTAMDEYQRQVSSSVAHQDTVNET